MTTMYGIPNCDTIKKAKKWLNDNNIDYTFHDYKKSGAQANIIEDAIAAVGADKVLNKRGTTYRKLSDELKQSINDDNIVAILCENTSMIKRPILVHKQHILVGFDSKQYTEVFNLG